MHSAVSIFLAMLVGILAQELRSPRVTNHGDWHEWSSCPPDTYAAGIQIKYEAHRYDMDDSALNAVSLYCLPPNWDRFNYDNWIISGEGPFGVWEQVKWCPKGQVIVGYMLRSESHQGEEDDAGADNFAAFCGSPLHGRDESNVIMGDTEGFGDWTQKQWCTEGYAVCSIRTQIEAHVLDIDDTSLNNVDVWCCKVDFQCTPDVQRVNLGSYDNTEGAGPMTFEYTVSTSFTDSSSTSNTLTTSEKEQIVKKISTELGIGTSDLSVKVAAELNHIYDKGFMQSLQTMLQETIQRTYQKKLTVNIDAGKRVVIEQLYFSCGSYRMGIAHTLSKVY